MAILLFWYPLFLFGRALISWFVAIFIIKETLECLDELCFLVLNIFLIRVTWKIYVFPFTCLFYCRTRCSLSMIIYWVKWILFFELIKTRAVFHILNVWDKWCLLVSYIFPIYSFKEFVVLDFLNSTRTKSIVDIAKKPFQDICCLWRKLGIIRNRERLTPM